MGFRRRSSRGADHVFLVLGFGPIAIMIATLRPAAVVTVAGGAWLALSPWILGYAGDHVAWLNELLAGALLSLLGANAAGVTGLGWVRVRRPSGEQRPRTHATADQ